MSCGSYILEFNDIYKKLSLISLNVPKIGLNSRKRAVRVPELSSELKGPVAGK